MRAFILLSLVSISENIFAHDYHFKGAYVWGAEVDAFRSCGSKEAYWVSHGWGSININLTEYYRKNTIKPYQELYIEFRGHYHQEESDGFAAEYAGIVHISEVFSVSNVLPPDC